MKHKTIKGLVSVGLPTYNRPELLKRALDIATSQTYSNLEIIVSDNASPDSCVKDVVDSYLSKDSRITYYRQEQNIGVLANADFVLQKSRGEYFTLLSDDDWRSPEFIEILVNELEERKNINLAFCDYREIYEDGQYAPGYPKTHCTIFKPFESNNRLIRTISYYWQDAKQGKPNLFYSVFRKTAVDSLDLKKLSGGFQRLNMDCLIVFSLLQTGPVTIISEVMCALTCGNEKHYSQNIKNKKTLLSKLTTFFSGHKKDRDVYIESTDSLLEKIIIYLLFIPKTIRLLASYVTNEILSKSQHYEINHQISEAVFSNSATVSGDNRTAANKVQLPNVTLVAMATRNVEETLQALIYSCADIEFGSVKLLSHYTPHGLNSTIEFIRIDKIKNIDEWSYKIIYELNEYIDTDYALLVHADGFVVNPLAWKEEFLSYDYIGAPWPLPTDDFSYRDVNGNIVRVGNSVSLRSKRLLELPIKLNLPWEPFHGFHNEDGFICVKNKHIYESHGMTLAPLDVAKYFSHEAMIPEVQGIKPFVFHKWAGTNSGYPRF